eukprot:Gb_23366 [translate_table: standard]
MAMLLLPLPVLPHRWESMKTKHWEFHKLASLGNMRLQENYLLKLARICPLKFQSSTTFACKIMALSVEAEKKIFDSKSEPPSIFDGTTRLYISRMCPYAQRVWIARNYKGLDDIQLVEVSLSDKPTWYKEKVYSAGKVPSLEHNGKVKGESLELLEYLDQNFGGPKILPLEPMKKEIAAELMKFTDTFAKAGFSSLSMKSATPAEIEKNFGPSLDHLEAALGKFSDDGPFFLGELGVVDIAYAPFIERFQLAFLNIKSYNITNGRPNLAKWIEAMDEVEAYTETKAEPSTLLEVYKRMLASDYFVKVGIATTTLDSNST